MASKKLQIKDTQPEWAGLESVADISEPKRFLSELLKESTAESLITRGYAVVKLDGDMKNAYTKFAIDFDAFCSQPIEEKAKFATKFTSIKHSPDQFHGYSRMEGLKEQYMVQSNRDQVINVR